MRLAADSHRLTRRLPMSERFELASQIRRAAVSVPANIAEGNGRFSVPDYLRHLSIAHGSLRELETLLMLTHAFGYVERSEIGTLLRRSRGVGQLIMRLAAGLRRANREARAGRSQFPVPSSPHS